MRDPRGRDAPGFRRTAIGLIAVAMAVEVFSDPAARDCGQTARIIWQSAGHQFA